jgi:ABC-type sugar transport system substrate-binding protein
MLRAKNPPGGEDGRRSVTGPKLMVGVLLLVALALGVVACGGSSSSSSSSDTTAESSELAESAGGTEPASSEGGEEEAGSGSIEGKKVTVVSVAEGNPWAAVFNKIIEEKLGAAGADVTVVGSLEPAAQVQMLNQAVAENPELIILEALDSKAVAPAVAKAKAQGIAVLNADGKADPSVESELNQVLSDNVALGEYAAENIVEGLEEEGKKSGNIGVITGTAAMLLTQERMEGFNKVLKANPSYKVVYEEDGNWEPVKSGELAKQMFAKFGKDGIQAAYGMADYMAVPIVTAAKQAGIPVGVKNNGLIVTGGNCFKVGIESIEAGEMYGTATEDPGTIAEQVSEYAQKMLEGQEVPLTETVEEARVYPKTLAQYTAQCTKA